MGSSKTAAAGSLRTESNKDSTTLAATEAHVLIVKPLSGNRNHLTLRSGVDRSSVMNSDFSTLYNYQTRSLGNKRRGLGPTLPSENMKPIAHQKLYLEEQRQHNSCQQGIPYGQCNPQGCDFEQKAKETQ